MRRIISTGIVTVVIGLGVLSAAPSSALDAEDAQQCERFIQRSAGNFNAVKAKIKATVVEYLKLRTSCDAGTPSEAVCERKTDRLILKIERLSEQLFTLSDDFFNNLSRVPACDEALGDLGVDDTMLF
jgi:hypothetical protein